MAHIYVIVAAAGGGARFSGALPKQYAPLAGVPLIVRTLERLAAVDAAATLVALAPGDGEYERVVGERRGVEVVRCGGATRAATVRNALALLAARCAGDDWVLVHDAARPLVPRDALARLVETLGDDPVGGLLAIPVADTLKRSDGTADAAPRIVGTEDRRGLWQAQTPQMFRFHILLAAMSLDAASSATDEAQAVESLAATGACAMPRLVRGSAANFKVTYPEDLALATTLLHAEH